MSDFSITASGVYTLNAKNNQGFPHSVGNPGVL